MDKQDNASKWAIALVACTGNRFDLALDSYAGIADQPQVLFNIGSIHKHLENYDNAIEYFTCYIIKERECPVGYFERASCFFYRGNFKMAVSDFSKAQRLMRNNIFINYSIRGLDVNLFLCEVLYNMASCYRRLDCLEKSDQCLLVASKFIVNDIQDRMIGALSRLGYGNGLFTIGNCAQFSCSDIKFKEKSNELIGNRNPISLHHRSSSESRIKPQETPQINQKNRHKSVILEKLSETSMYENILKEPHFAFFQQNSTILKVRISSEFIIMMSVKNNSHLDAVKRKIQEKLGNIGQKRYAEMLLFKDGFLISSDVELRKLMLQKKVLDLVVQPDVVDIYFEL